MRYSSLGALAISICTAAGAQAASQASTAQKDVLDALHQLTEAQAQCSPDVEKLRVPDHTIIGPGGGLATGDAIRQMNERCQKRKPTVQGEVHVRVYNGDTAIVTGVDTMYGVDGQPLPRRRFTSVWVKMDGAWRHASYQATVLASPAGRGQ